MAHQVKFETIFTEDMNALRKVCFPGPLDLPSSRDEFDDRSIYPCVYIDGRVAAYGRLTPGPNSVFENWTSGKAHIPVGEYVIDLGRFLVHPDFRGQNLLELLCVESIRYSREAGFKALVGAVVPGRKLAGLLAEIGFVNAGPPVVQLAPNRGPVTVQPLVIYLQ